MQLPNNQFVVFFLHPNFGVCKKFWRKYLIHNAFVLSGRTQLYPYTHGVAMGYVL